METVVIFNMGKQARADGLPCVAPDSVMYPIVSRYVPFHREEATLDKHMQGVWLRGYNA